MMISQSVTVGKAADIKPGELVAFDASGVRIAVGNADGCLFAIGELCTHEQCSLAEDGILDGMVLTCGCHGAQFDVTTGSVLAPPAVEPLKVYRSGLMGAMPLIKARTLVDRRQLADESVDLRNLLGSDGEGDRTTGGS